MTEEMEKAVFSFCTHQPNLSPLHHPNDTGRLLKIIYLSLKNNEQIPYGQIQKGLEENTSCHFGGTIAGFMQDCEEYAKDAVAILQDAKRIGILK